MTTRARRTDSNHREVADALEAVGAAVLDIHALPGALDLLCGYRGRLILLEIKDGAKPPSARRLTEAEADTIGRFMAVGAPVYVVASVEDALRAIGAISSVT
jgi:hypothetical protein